MSTQLRVYVNDDDALLFWSIPAPIEGCRGFAIERNILRQGQAQRARGFLMNRTGFEGEVAAADAAEHPPMKSSSEWPFQRFSWTDHDANSGDAVSYRIVPVCRGADRKLQLLESHASAWSEDRQLGGNGDGKFRPFFNRGFVMSQFMARYLADRHLTLDQFKERIKDEDDHTIRGFLSGGLRSALLEQLKIALESGGHVYAALFELSDDELISALCALKGQAHVVLGNGSVKAAKGESAADARRKDDNERARALLREHDVDVEEANRFIAPGALAHNKFLVRTDADGQPLIAWTGSTNWAPTGLCTQVNNGLLIQDSDVATVYLEQWRVLRSIGSEFPKLFVEANSKPRATGGEPRGAVRSTVWFTRTRAGVDLEALRDEVRKARQGILFLMFMPGATGLFSTVAARSAEPDLYVRGVVSSLPNGRGDESEVEVGLIDGSTHRSLHLDVIQPEGVQHPFASFAAEVTRKQFLADVGHAIIHSKVLVIDPFSAHPVVITGSHNFSTAASGKNDENFIIVRDDPKLAEAYAVNVLGAYAHYRWRAFLAETQMPFNGLKDDDRWQEPKIKLEQRELRFWGV